MQASQHEKLSLLVDDQLDKDQALSLLRTLQQDTELQARYQRYAMISQALKGDQCSVASLDFAAGVRQQLKQEAVYFLPQKKSRTAAAKTALAVAASVLLVVVGFSVRQLQLQNPSVPGTNTLAQNEVPADQANARFKEYLQAHDNTWYVNNNGGVKSYSRLASFQSQ